MDTASARQRPTQQHNALARDHLNLAEFPISVLQRRQPTDTNGRKHDTVTFRSHTYDQQVGEWVPQTVTLTTNSRYGLPTPADETVVLALLLLGKQDNFANNRIYFTCSQLIRLMRWADNGRSYTRIKDVFRRLKALTVLYENAWWDSHGREFEEEYATGIIADYRLVRQVSGPKRGGEKELCWVRWSPDFYDSLLTQGTLKRLNLDELLGLSLATAQRMYRFLDKHFHYTDELRFDLRDFGCGHIGLAESYKTGQLKQKLAPAIAELERIGYIEKMPAKERYTKVKKGVWKVNFRKAVAAQYLRLARTDEESTAADDRRLVEQLTTRGVTAKMAARLVAAHPASRIVEKIEIVDWLLAGKDARVSKNPPGWLIRAIEEDYAKPANFETTADRQRRSGQEKQKRKQQRHQRDQEQEERAKEQVRHDYLIARWRPNWDALTDDDREQIRGELLEAKFPTVTDRRQQRQLLKSHLFLMACLEYLEQQHAAVEASTT